MRDRSVGLRHIYSLGRFLLGRLAGHLGLQRLGSARYQEVFCRQPPGLWLDICQACPITWNISRWVASSQRRNSLYRLRYFVLLVLHTVAKAERCSVDSSRISAALSWVHSAGYRINLSLPES